MLIVQITQIANTTKSDVQEFTKRITNTESKIHLGNTILGRDYMHTKTTKTLSVICLRSIYTLMIII